MTSKVRDSNTFARWLCANHRNAMNSAEGSLEEQKIDLVLLKSPSPSISADPYTTVLTPLLPPSHQPTYVPVLRHTLHPDFLIRLLLTYVCSPSTSHPLQFPYGALVLTSQRAVAALSAAISSPPLTKEREKDPERWRQRVTELRTRLYTVGPATARAARDLAGTWLPNCEVLGGEKAGSGELLAQVILGDTQDSNTTSDTEAGDGYNEWEGAYMSENVEEDMDDSVGKQGLQKPTEPTTHSSTFHKQSTSQEAEAHTTDSRRAQQQRKRRKKPILFLAGETHRDIIPRTLQSTSLTPDARIEVSERVVYGSSEREDFGFELAKALKRLLPPAAAAAGEESRPAARIITLFSPLPTSITTLFTQLEWLDPTTKKVLPELTQPAPPPSSSLEEGTYIACIGPTTRDGLRAAVGYEADIVALRPSPEGLKEAVERWLANKPASHPVGLKE